MTGKPFVQITRDVSKALEGLRAETPRSNERIQAVGSRRTTRRSALRAEQGNDRIGHRCRLTLRCLHRFQVKALIRLGVSREQLMETLAIRTNMGEGRR
ncbi:Uncharacterized protein ToN1_37230 [Aromatoleum petrolei]|nr:Uncharacterized protein ToN1_37230 [Aromatoleum petrolei]